MNSRQKTSARRAYTRPEVWVVPCNIPAIMGPSLHAQGSNWINKPDTPLGFDQYVRPNAPTSFQLRSVWDATAKELQDGQLVVISYDE